MAKSLCLHAVRRPSRSSVDMDTEFELVSLSLCACMRKMGRLV